MLLRCVLEFEAFCRVVSSLYIFFVYRLNDGLINGLLNSENSKFSIKRTRFFTVVR